MRLNRLRSGQQVAKLDQWRRGPPALFGRTLENAILILKTQRADAARIVDCQEEVEGVQGTALDVRAGASGLPSAVASQAASFGARWLTLVRAGRDPADLAREFEPSAQAIRNWVAQSDRREGRREEKSDVLPAADRDELVRLRRENKQLRLERDILSRAAAWFARETGAVPSGSSNS
jgi:transposase